MGKEKVLITCRKNIYERYHSIRHNFVWSNKKLKSVRPMSDRTPDYFNSTAKIGEIQKYVVSFGQHMSHIL